MSQQETTESIQNLERTILQLGTDLYHVKNTLQDMRNRNTSLEKTVETLRTALEEKEVLSRDEFDEICDLQEDYDLPQEALNLLDGGPNKDKKTGH